MTLPNFDARNAVFNNPGRDQVNVVFGQLLHSTKFP
jgi:hypothetical protein